MDEADQDVKSADATISAVRVNLSMKNIGFIGLPTPNAARWSDEPVKNSQRVGSRKRKCSKP
jgi:hypothetical protein